MIEDVIIVNSSFYKNNEFSTRRLEEKTIYSRRLYLIKPNENNNYSYEEFLIANEDEITLVKHIIGDGSNSIKNRERLTPSTLIARLTELEEQKNSDKKRVRNKF